MARTVIIHGSVVGDLANRLVLVRRAHGLTQQRLAQLLHVDQATISNLETGRTVPTVPLLLQIAYRFDVSLDWLASGHGPILRQVFDTVHYLGDAEYAEPCRAAVELLKAEESKYSFCRLDVSGLDEQYGWLFWRLDGPYITVLPGEQKPGIMLRSLADLIISGHHLRGALIVLPKQLQSMINRTLTGAGIRDLVKADFQRTGLEEVETATGLRSQDKRIVRDAITRLAKEETARVCDPGQLDELIGLLNLRPELINIVTEYARNKANSS